MEVLTIQNKIYEVRGERVMFDFDLALLFDTETRKLKQSDKRNIVRFPKSFIFVLSANEWAQVITNCDNLPQNIRYSPILFCIGLHPMHYYVAPSGLLYEIRSSATRPSRRSYIKSLSATSPSPIL